MKNPSGALAREGFATAGWFRLSRTSPISRACAVERPLAVWQSLANFQCRFHCSTHVAHELQVREGAPSMLVEFIRQARAKEIFACDFCVTPDAHCRGQVMRN